jgi:hypothetical protein
MPGVLIRVTHTQYNAGFWASGATRLEQSTIVVLCVIWVSGRLMG